MNSLLFTFVYTLAALGILVVFHIFGVNFPVLNWIAVNVVACPAAFWLWRRA